jgi:hypothetical protein
MQKLIYLFKADARQRRESLAEQLLEAGRRILALRPLGLRLNVHDATVAAGHPVEITSQHGPFEAVVQLWLADESPYDPYEEELSRLGMTFHGYLVDERLLVHNLANAPGDGERSQGYSQLAMLQIPHWLDRASWLERWQRRHTWVALSIHPHLEYTQNPLIRALTDGAPPIEGFGEETFPIEALEDERVLYKAVDDPGKCAARREVMFEDAGRFIDFKTLDMIVTSQFDLRLPPR